MASGNANQEHVTYDGKLYLKNTLKDGRTLYMREADNKIYSEFVKEDGTKEYRCIGEGEGSNYGGWAYKTEAGGKVKEVQK